MELAWEKVRDRIEVSDFGLAGYSLGGIQSAYVSQLDEERRLFDFKRVLLINPPANLYNSVSLLDQLLAENIPGGPENFNAWFGSVLEKLAMLEKELGYVELTGEYLYKVYKRFPPREDFLAALIGLSFRMDSANMIFSSDVMNGGGYIAPAGARLTASTDLTPFAMVAYRTTFGDYFHEYFFPFFRRGEPGLTEEALIERMSLHHIEAYLRSAEKIGLIHNEDDIIMSPGEVDYLGEVFGERARIFPTGGHCGNMNHPDVVRFIVDFLAGKEG